MTPSNIVLIRSLANYLKGEMGAIPVIENWPDPKVEMELPVISVMVVGNPIYTHKFPSQFITFPDEEKAGNVREITEIGYYDYKIQIDIWAEYQAQRDELYELVHQALNKDFYEKDAPLGLSLILDDYHNAIARVDQVGYANMDNGDNSQRQEWRIKIDCAVNFPKLAEKSMPVMNEMNIETEISENQMVDETFEIF
jgi:hypothetical protein